MLLLMSSVEMGVMGEGQTHSHKVNNTIGKFIY